MYKEIKPSEGLSYLIDSFWTFSNDGVSNKFKVLPDTYTDLIVDLNTNKSYLSGIMANYQFRELEKDSELIGIRFKTEEFASLVEMPFSEIRNLRVELSQTQSSKNFKTLNQIAGIESITEKIYFLESFITKSFNQNERKRDEMIIAIARYIRSVKGIVNIKTLADTYYISLRQLERRFKSNMGLTLKEFSNVVRFNNARKAVATLTKTSLLEIAFDFGFFDHAHMNYEFKRIAGENPSSFR